MADTEKKAPAKPRKTAAKSTAVKAATTKPAKDAAAENGAARKGTIHLQPAADGVAKFEQPSKAVSHEDIARLAHRYWAERGYQHGQHEVDWQRAERELRGKAS